MDTPCVVFHSPLFEPGGPCRAPQALLRRLVFGNIAVGMLVEQEDAQQASLQRQFLQTLQLPQEVLTLTTTRVTQLISLRFLRQELTSREDVWYITSGCNDSGFALAKELARSAGCALILWRDYSEQAAKCHIPSGQPVIRSEQDLMQLLAQEERSKPGVLCVGVAMKPSREAQLAARGFFPIAATSGLCFLPLSPAILGNARITIDVILHKISDELESLEDGTLHFSPLADSIAEYAHVHPHACIVDPLPAVRQVLDRQAMSGVLMDVSAAAISQQIPIRCPGFVRIEAGEGAAEVQRKAEAHGMALPCIIKTVIACGTADSHKMALLLTWDGLPSMAVPRPAILQEFLNHGSILHKVYVLGDKVHIVERPSIADLPVLKLGKVVAPGVVNFDSLEGLPSALQLEQACGPLPAPQGSAGHLRQAYVDAAVDLLKQKFGLSLFGFDIVVVWSGRHYIVDVNYFPSFKDVPDAKEHVWALLKQAHARWRPDGGRSVEVMAL